MALLEEQASFELLLVNPRHVKNLPGRKTDVADSEWLAQLLECGLLKGSFIPPKEVARLRGFTRYRTLVRERAREVQRLQKLLEDSGVKLESVVTDVTGKAARRMIEALIAGEKDPEVLAEMALTRMRPKIPELKKALLGRFDAHHGLLARMHLDHIDHLDEMVVSLDEEVDRLMAPFAEPATRLLTILLGLAWADVDLDAGTLRVRQALNRAGGAAFVLGEPKTPKSRRTLDVPSPAVEALRAHRARQAAERLAAGSVWVDTGLVFATEIGTVLDPRNFRRAFARVTEAAGLGSGWHPHELRHSAVSLLSAAGVRLEDVADVVGHASASRMTGDVYRHQVHPSVSAAKAPMEAMFGVPGAV